jgi:hypothetical protein
MKMFSKNCSEETLKERNLLIKIMQIILWSLNFIIDLPVIIRLIFNNDYGFHHFRGVNPPQVEYIILTAIIFIIAIRFEFWSTFYWADRYPEDGGDWVSNYRKNHSIHQSKFFTFKPHKKGDLNPFW